MECKQLSLDLCYDLALNIFRFLIHQTQFNVYHYEMKSQSQVLDKMLVGIRISLLYKHLEKR
jgi:hypothetical protein